jgi:hypothetical protein
MRNLYPRLFEPRVLASGLPNPASAAAGVSRACPAGGGGATELDLGPPATYPWLEENHRRFGFVWRYKWHYEFALAL